MDTEHVVLAAVWVAVGIVVAFAVYSYIAPYVAKVAPA